jgi:hypothetical protein
MDGKIKGLQHGRSSLKLADQALEKAREQETAETHLKILEGRWAGEHSQGYPSRDRGQVRLIRTYFVTNTLSRIFHRCCLVSMNQMSPGWPELPLRRL